MTQKNPSATEENIKAAFTRLAKLADDDGFIVTIEQQPIQPVTLGTYETVVTVREKS